MRAIAYIQFKPRKIWNFKHIRDISFGLETKRREEGGSYLFSLSPTTSSPTPSDSATPVALRSGFYARIYILLSLRQWITSSPFSIFLPLFLNGKTSPLEWSNIYLQERKWRGPRAYECSVNFLNQRGLSQSTHSSNPPLIASHLFSHYFLARALPFRLCAFAVAEPLFIPGLDQEPIGWEG